jgi:putative glutathione S-transferase
MRTLVLLIIMLYYNINNKLNHASFRDINSGVYRAGFATQQAAYEEAAYQLFKSLDRVSNY